MMQGQNIPPGCGGKKRIQVNPTDSRSASLEETQPNM